MFALPPPPRPEFICHLKIDKVVLLPADAILWADRNELVTELVSGGNNRGIWVGSFDKF